MTTISFEAFWEWVVQHPNCILRAGGVDSVLYDDPDFHWYLGPEGGGLVVQLIRGKRLVGEVVLDPERVSYVQETGEQREGEHVFELVSETDRDRYVAYVFVLNHGLDGDDGKQPAGHATAVH